MGRRGGEGKGREGRETGKGEGKGKGRTGDVEGKGEGEGGKGEGKGRGTGTRTPSQKSLATGLTIASIQLLEIDNNLMAGICTVRILPKVRVSFEFKIFSAHQFWFGPVRYKMRVFVRFIGYSRGVYSI